MQKSYFYKMQKEIIANCILIVLKVEKKYPDYEIKNQKFLFIKLLKKKKYFLRNIFNVSNPPHLIG